MLPAWATSTPTKIPPTGCVCACTHTTTNGGVEICDGLDNNCNGVIDDGVTVPVGFQCADQGVCAGCQNGEHLRAYVQGVARLVLRDYSALAGVDIDSAGNLTLIENECDGLDNNCNGVVDKDGFPTLGNSAMRLGPGRVLPAARHRRHVRYSDERGVQRGGGAAVRRARRRLQRAGRQLRRSSSTSSQARDGHVLLHGQPGQRQAQRVPRLVGRRRADHRAQRRARCSSTPTRRRAPGATSSSAGVLATRSCSTRRGCCPGAASPRSRRRLPAARSSDSAGKPGCACAPPTSGRLPARVPAARSRGLVLGHYEERHEVSGRHLQRHRRHHRCALGDGNRERRGDRRTAEFCYANWAAPTATSTTCSACNLEEWTSTPVVASGTTYYKLRGGSFGSPAGAEHRLRVRLRHQLPTSSRRRPGFPLLRGSRALR